MAQGCCFFNLFMDSVFWRHFIPYNGDFLFRLAFYRSFNY